jgi:antitoxin component YwqK of YwqJK toxin-antitoxin module
MGIFNFFEKPKVVKVYYENGTLKNETTLKSGKKEGTEKGYHDNGILHYQAEWYKGKQNGITTSFDKEGNKVKQSSFRMGVYEGPQKEWWPNGELKADRIFNNDKIVSEETYNSKGKLVVHIDKLQDIGIVTHYKGQPFTGIMYIDKKRSITGLAIPTNIEIEMVDGLKDGFKNEFFNDGKLKMQTKYSKDKFVNICGYFDSKGNNILDNKICVEYEMLVEENNTYLYNNKPFTGLSLFDEGRWTALYKDGVEITRKHFFQDGSVKNIRENINGELIETKGWIKIDENGEYDENGKKILVREFNNGKQIEYYENGNIKSEKDVFQRKSENDKNSVDTFSKTSYYENGKIREHKVCNKYDSDGYSGGDEIEYAFYYESGELYKEKVNDNKYLTKYISYYKNKSIKSISISETEYTHQGFTFEFDEKGNEISTINPNSEKEDEVRKYLKLKRASKEEKIKANEEENKRLSREISVIIDDITFQTTVGEFESAEPECAIRDEDSYQVTELDDETEEFALYTSDSHDDVVTFFQNFTKKKLVITTEYRGYDQELGVIEIEEVGFINCECPAKLKKYYNGQLFIKFYGKLLEVNSEDFKKINFNDILDEAEIRNSGVECLEYDYYIKNI